jgi:N-acetylmuramic acid 6-phosphate etherase
LVFLALRKKKLCGLCVLSGSILFSVAGQKIFIISCAMKKRKPISITEERNPSSRHIDTAAPLEIARIMNREDERVARAVRTQLRPIAKAIALGAEALSRGGRLFYAGAGTSGRLGVLDAAECPPTFSVSPKMVQGIIAGGKRALWRSVEAAEDNLSAGARAIRRARVNARDVVCGISASGKTPFVRGALGEAQKRGALRLLVACNPSPEIGPLADVVIQLLVGPEIIAGSTRLKAGTATKMVLNMLSTGIMIRLGKVYGNLMVDVKPSSRKLKDRAERILMTFLNCPRDRARVLLRQSKNHPKAAIVMGAEGCSRKEAERWLEEKKGILGEIL